MLLPTLVLTAAFAPLPHGLRGGEAAGRHMCLRVAPSRLAAAPFATDRSLYASCGSAARLHASAPRSRRAPPPRLELGLQVDPLATGSTLFVFGLLALLQLKIKSAEATRGKRDQAVETYRQAEVLLLAGRVTSEEVDRAWRAAEEAVAAYDDSRRILSIPGTLLRLPDPTAKEVARILKKPPPEGKSTPTPVAAAPPPQPQASQTEDPLERVRRALRLSEKEGLPPGSTGLLPTGSASVTLKDVAIGIALALQIGWFFLSLTDPMGTPNPILNAALSSGGELVDQREARRAAESDEYAAMLRAAVESGEAPPTCATRKLDDPEGGCANTDGRASLDGLEEKSRTQGLDANRAWITGPNTAAGGGTPPGF